MQKTIERFAWVDQADPAPATAAAVAPMIAPTPHRLSGLDGLRAIAVIGVFLFHSDLTWARGGYLGVDLFFVISGFLITHLLAREVEATGKLNLAGFYWRRAKRLLPASWLMTAAAIIAAGLLAPEALHRLRGDALASLFYVTNWELLSVKASYFETIGRQPLLLHLWSLAIEEQFYILWAPLLVFGLHRLGRVRLAFFAALLAAMSVAWMGYLATRNGYLVDVTPTRLDFGTDTHSFPLLIGAVLGLLWRPDRQTPVDPSASKSSHVSDGVFTLGLIVLGATLYLLSRLGEETEGLYPWGFLLSALTSAALVAAATFRGSLFGRWLDQQPLRWLGERSYGLYLWHWPIFMLTRPEDLHLDANLILAIRIVLTLIIAALSYRFVETPIRGGLLERIGTGLKTPGRRLASFGAGVLVTMAVAAVVLPVVATLKSPGPITFPLFGGTAAAASRPPAPKPAAPVVKPPPPKMFSGPDVTAIGDSVLLGSLGPFKAKLPGAKVYAKVGWQARDVLGQLRALSTARALTPVVVIHLGTNGFVYEDQLRDILSLLADRQRVILVNAHVPRRWMTPNNELFDRVLPNYPNVVLANWRKASEDKPAYFVADHFHLTPTGQRALVAEIMSAGHLSAPGSDNAAPKPAPGIAAPAVEKTQPSP